MSEQPIPPEDQVNTCTKTPTRDLFIRGIPEDVWDHVHHNALRSRLRLKPFLIEVLRQSQPFPRQSPTDKATPTS